MSPVPWSFLVRVHEENGLHSVVFMHDVSRAHIESANSHLEGVDYQLRVLIGVDGPSDDRATASGHHAADVNLSFLRWVFRNVAAPGLIEQ